MRIVVEFIGFPNAVEAVGQKQTDLDVPGNTIKDLLDELVRRYGQKLKDSFYGADGSFDLNVQIIVNEESFLSVDKHDTPLHEGDHVTFMLVLAGG